MAGQVEIPGDDPDYIYTPEEQHTLTLHLVALTTEVHRGDFRGRSIDQTFLSDLHGRLFHGVRGFAGRIRNRDFGTLYLNFGPNRSAPKDEVPSLLKDLFFKLRMGRQSLSENTSASDYEEKAIYWAVWAHAEVIRIHPFQDGNGRTARLLMSHVLVELGLRPIPIEAARQEYEIVLNRYFAQGDRKPLEDLFLRLASPSS